jgi:hypothetical protein
MPARQRVEIEEAWLQLGRDSGKPVQIFRLSGIYGLAATPSPSCATARRTG